MKKMNKSKSRSPKSSHYNNPFGFSSDEIPERGSAVKMYQEADSVPSWYKSLKK